MAHQQLFWNIGHVLNRSNSLDLQLQNRIKCAPLHYTFLVYIKGSWTLGKPYGAIGNILGEHIWEHIGNLGTCWEQGRKKKKTSPPHTQKEKTRPIMSACWAFPLAAFRISISKTVCHHFWPGLMAGAEIWGHS